MIKSAIKHSAIRSPFRNPFVPGDDGYREYLKRSVFELNGTQNGVFSETYVLDSDFEIEWDGLAPSSEFNQAVISKELFAKLLIKSTGEAHLLIGNGTNWVSYALQSTTLVNDGKIHKITARRTGNNYSLSVDGQLESTTVITNGDVQFSALFKRSSSGADYFKGISASLKIWTNGDRNTGDLILNVPFDESGSDYQRNHAVALGAELVTNGDFSDDLTGWTLESSTGGIVNGAADFITETSYGYIYQEFDSDAECFVLEFEVLAGTSNSQVTVNTYGKVGTGVSDIDLGALRFGVGKHKVYARSAGLSLVRFRNAESGARTVLDNISIKEWSGVILQSALPEDWMQIEKKRWWDYWLSVELSPNVTMDIDLYGWAGAGVDDGYWFWDGGRAACAGLNSYTHNIAKYGIFEIGNTYRISYDGWVDNAGFGHQDGDNQVIPELTITTLVNHVEHDWVADSENFNVKRTIGTVNNGWLDNVSIRRKLEIAQ